MQTIGQIIQKNKEQTNTLSDNSLPTVSKENKVWIAKWKSHSDIERVFSPANWSYTIANPKRAYQAECPTLVSYDNVYGEGVAAEWIYMQVLALYGSSNCKDIGVADGIKLFAHNFAYEVKSYKLSELMLFFARYKAGKYDNSYTTFDARRIGRAFFNEFVRERNYELDSINRIEEQKKIEERRFIPPHGYSSLSWYNELKIRAGKGDDEAKLILYGKN